MISALLFLQFHSWRNRLRSRGRRLKNPKYLAGAIIGGLYLGFYFFWVLRGTGAGQSSALSAPSDAEHLALAENVGAAILLLLVVSGWIFPNERAALAFTEAEVAFLFPAPISRRGLINYKLVRSQMAILLSTIFLTLIWGRWRQGGHVWISVLGWWTILSTLNLHGLAGSFARTMLFDRGITNLRRRMIILIGLVVVIGAVCKLSWASWPDLPPNADAKELFEWSKTILSTGISPYLLAPFRLVVKPYFAPDAVSFFEAWLPALGLLVLHYFIVVRTNVAFEEASIAYSQKMAARIETMRERRVGGGAPQKPRRAPFTLRPTGLPSIAFLWKNLILSGSFFSLTTFLRLAVLLAIVTSSLLHGSHSAASQTGLGFMAGMILILSLFWGQNLLRADFRADLNSADLLKAYPLPGWQVVLGEVLAPTVVLAAGQWLLILFMAIFIAPPQGPRALAERVGITLAAMALAPAVDLIVILIPNAAALLMPSWVRFDKNAPRGFENFGQNVILGIGQLFVMLVALVPAGLAFWATFALVGWVLGMVVAPLSAALVATLVLAAEAATAIYFLGLAFERFDLTAETVN